MNSARMICLVLALFAGTLAGAQGSNAMASGEAPADSAQEKTETTTLPETEFEPEGSFFLGYRFLSHEDYLKAAEHVYPHSSITFGIDLLGCPLPHRYHLHGEYLSKYDFYADAGYAYKDLLYFRNILVGVHHNLEHYDYMYPGDPPAVTYMDRDPDVPYFVDYVNNYMVFRLKAPDFPMHGFVKHRYVEREGDVPVQFVLGAIGGLVKTSENRTIDWHSDALTLGANSHMGPIEVEYAFDTSDFDPGPGSVLLDYYPTSFVFGRPGDIYPHSVIPETETYGNTLKLHTSYTGGIVAAATLSNVTQKNAYSGTEATNWKGAFDLSWIPDPVIGLFFKYRHRQRYVDSPATVMVSGTANTMLYKVRPAVSYDRDQFYLTARYKPMPKLTLLGTYDFSRLRRDGTDEWNVLIDQTDRHNLNLTAQARPLSNLKLKAVYDYIHFDDPSYNTEPDNTNRLRLTATYLPLPWLTAFADYTLTVTDRDDLVYLGTRPPANNVDGEREGRSDRMLLSLSAMMSPKVTATASWTYSRWKLEQDMVFARRGQGSLVEPGVLYDDEANTFSLSLHYLPRKDITILADLTYALSEGDYRPGMLPETSSLRLPEYCELEAAETVLSLEAAKRMWDDWEVGIRFEMDIYDDRAGDVQDGELYVTTLSLKRYF